MAKLVFNIERINASQLKAQQAHDQRTMGNLTHTNPRLKCANQALIGTGAAYDDVQALMEKKAVKVRSDNNAPYTRIVISASPEHLDDFDNYKKWVSDSTAFLIKEYGEGVAYAYLHMDEKTPHIHAVIVPLVETKRGLMSSHHKHPSHTGMNSYERLRRRCADHLGLEYGEPGNKPKTQAKAIIDKAKEQAASIISNASTTALSMFNIAHQERQSLQQEREQLEREKAAHNQKADALKKEAIALNTFSNANRIEELKHPAPTFEDKPTPQRTRRIKFQEMAR